MSTKDCIISEEAERRILSEKQVCDSTDRIKDELRRLDTSKELHLKASEYHLKEVKSIQEKMITLHQFFNEINDRSDTYIK